MACIGGPTREETEIQENRQYRHDLYMSYATPLLCEACKEMEKYDMMKYRSQELQNFWKKHKVDDAKRIELELEKSKENSEKSDAISKLTERERKILGLL